ncbi:hypothetical protein K439DRAFT_1043673 [Ramaria rubella]|nr:hypothetical protein K439DRAFT_1043673 [Ramaria rubella]
MMFACIISSVWRLLRCHCEDRPCITFFSIIAIHKICVEPLEKNLFGILWGRPTHHTNPKDFCALYQLSPSRPMKTWLRRPSRKVEIALDVRTWRPFRGLRVHILLKHISSLGTLMIPWFVRCLSRH